MTRILFFVSSMQGGGAERVAAILCNRWVENGHEVTLVPTFSERGTCIYPLDKRVRLIFLADRVSTTRKTAWTMARRLWAMRRLVSETGAEVVLSFLPHVNVATLLATRGLGVPVVVSERTYPPAQDLGSVWPRLRRITYPWAARVVMQTDRGREWLRREVPYAHGTAIPNPCVFPLAESEPRIAPDDVMPAESHLLLAVGRLSEEKQFKLLVQTFSNLAPRFPHWNLAILGEGAERQAIEAQIAAAGLSGRIFLPGRVGNVSTWYDRADLYVMSSRFEGFPNSLLEALAYGLAAVSFDCATGPSDLIDDGVNGFLVPPTKGAAGLLERLALLMSNPDIRAEFATQAAVVRERYSISQVGENWDRVLGLGCRDN